MKALWKYALLAGCAWSATAMTAVAQDAPADTESAEVEEVIVTARRREESLQDVPIAVSAYSEEKLETLGARDITDLQRTTPSITVQTARGSNSTLISFIRGVGQQDPLWGFESGVGLYVDDVYVARPQAAVLDIFDISRIEVLRGPQGTLYGRNTVGGAIKYVTDKIGAEPELKVRGAVGSYNQTDLIVSGESPLTDKVSVGAALAVYKRDGFGQNLNTGAEHYNKDVKAARASIEFTPTDDLFFRLSGDIIRDDSNPRHGHRETAFAGDPQGGVPSSVYDTRAGSGDENKVVTRGVSLLGEWALSDALTFKSISAYRSGETEGTIDFDNLPFAYLDVPAYYTDHQFSQEFQLLFEGERWQGVAGVYYLNATAAGAFDTVVGAFGVTTFTGGYVDTRSWAAFADLSFDLTDQLSVSVGGRFTKDDKKGNVLRQVYLGQRSPFFGNPAAIAFGAPRTNYTNEKSFEEFTPRVSVTYEFSPEMTAYASYGRGFKSGGFDMRGDATLYPQTVEGYEPEFVDTTEVGLKGSLLDRRVNFATAIFHSKYTDMQIGNQYVFPPAQVASVVDNVGEATIKGWEFEGTARLADFLLIGGAASYIDAEFDEYLSFIPGAPLPGFPCAPNAPFAPTPQGCLVDVKDLRDFQNTPEWTGSVYATFTHDLQGGMGSFSFTPSAAYRSEVQQFETASVIDQDAYWLYDASLVWNSEGGRYQASLIGRNLSDERYRVGGYTFGTIANSINAFYGAPRTWTASLQVKF